MGIEFVVNTPGFVRKCSRKRLGIIGRIQESGLRQFWSEHVARGSRQVYR
jgi:hypothetical protein